MSRPLYTPEQWNEIFDRYLASGLTQRAFCEQNAVPFDTFRHRYRKSEKFAGKRRGLTPSARAGFIAVKRGDGTNASARNAANVTIRLGASVTIDCPLQIGATLIAEIAREAAR